MKRKVCHPLASIYSKNRATIDDYSFFLCVSLLLLLYLFRVSINIFAFVFYIFHLLMCLQSIVILFVIMKCSDALSKA